MCKYSYMDTPKTHLKNKTNLLKEKNPITDMGAVDIAQSVQRFLRKRENQSSDPQHWKWQCVPVILSWGNKDRRTPWGLLAS